MPAAYSVDLRRRVISAVTSGMSRKDAATRFEVSLSSVAYWMREYARTGRDTPAPAGGDRRSHVIEAHADKILDKIADSPDVTIDEIRAFLLEKHKLTFSFGAVQRFLKRRDITFKKNRARRRTNA